MRDILYKIAHRMISTAWKPLDASAERLYLYLTILRQLQLHDEAMTLLKSDQGRLICARSLSCDEVRRELVKASGAVQEEGDVAQARIMDEG
jgi:N-terminal acetyltransferase B complex non-catalytic subunit